MAGSGKHRKLTYFLTLIFLGPIVSWFFPCPVKDCAANHSLSAAQTCASSIALGPRKSASSLWCGHRSLAPKYKVKWFSAPEILRTSHWLVREWRIHTGKKWKNWRVSDSIYIELTMFNFLVGSPSLLDPKFNSGKTFQKNWSDRLTRDASAVPLAFSCGPLCFLWPAAFVARVFASTCSSRVASFPVGSAVGSSVPSSLLLPTQNPALALTATIHGYPMIPRVSWSHWGYPWGKWWGKSTGTRLDFASANQLLGSLVQRPLLLVCQILLGHLPMERYLIAEAAAQVRHHPSQRAEDRASFCH